MCVLVLSYLIYALKEVTQILKKYKSLRYWITYPLLWAIFLSNLFILKEYFVEWRRIISASMEPNFYINDHILINKFKFDVKRGHVYAFKVKKEEGSYVFIKRLIGLPKDIVKYDAINIFLNNKSPKQKENCAINSTDKKLWIERIEKVSYCLIDNEKETPLKRNIYLTKEVNENSYFIVGDNRISSFDSRFSKWPYKLDRSKILGKAYRFPF